MYDWFKKKCYSFPERKTFPARRQVIGTCQGLGARGSGVASQSPEHMYDIDTDACWNTMLRVCQGHGVRENEAKSRLWAIGLVATHPPSIRVFPPDTAADAHDLLRLDVVEEGHGLARVHHKQHLPLVVFRRSAKSKRNAQEKGTQGQARRRRRRRRSCKQGRNMGGGAKNEKTRHTPVIDWHTSVHGRKHAACRGKTIPQP